MSYKTLHLVLYYEVVSGTSTGSLMCQYVNLAYKTQDMYIVKGGWFYIFLYVFYFVSSTSHYKSIVLNIPLLIKNEIVSLSSKQVL